MGVKSSIAIFFFQQQKIMSWHWQQLWLPGITKTKSLCLIFELEITRNIHIKIAVIFKTGVEYTRLSQ